MRGFVLLLWAAAALADGYPEGRSVQTIEGTETALLVPMTEGLSFKASLVDLYNSSPDEDSQSNTLSTLLGLSLGF